MFRVAEFFAGIGLVRMALEREGFQVAFANDIDPIKRQLYAANFASDSFVLKDVRKVSGKDIPTVDLATASFPCIDLSLAGNWAGLHGEHSTTFFEFVRVLEEMGGRRPSTVMLENVVGFVTSKGGKDLKNAITRLNELGYWCDILIADARWFAPQSRPRLFIVGSREKTATATAPHPFRPQWLRAFITAQSGLKIQNMALPPPPAAELKLADIVERMDDDDPRWWERPRFVRFRNSLGPIHAKRFEQLRRLPERNWATAYRRTREQRPTWEIRADGISGCLRTARGGSSKQALVEAGRDAARVRWMTPREYARLQGAGNYNFAEVRPNACLSAFGDAVCVPVVQWIARHCLKPMLTGKADEEGQLRFAV